MGVGSPPVGPAPDAHEFIRRGAQPVLVGRDLERLQRSAEHPGVGYAVWPGFA